MADPVLIHIGYHKTGTNWLQRELFSGSATGYRWLGKRPESHPIWGIVNVRALEFDAADVRANLEPQLHKAENRGAVPSSRWSASPAIRSRAAHDAGQIAERLRAVFPDSRVLAVIREQRTMIVSTYKQYVKAGGACTLEQVLDPPTRQNWRVPWFDFRHFEYDHLIRRYHDLWGPENVLVLPYEQFIRDGRGFVERIAAFAGRPVPTDVLDRLPYAKRYNASPSAATVSAVRRLRQFTPRTELNPAPLVQSRLLEHLCDDMEKGDLLGSRLPRLLAERTEGRLREAVANAVGDRYAAEQREDRRADRPRPRRPGLARGRVVLRGGRSGSAAPRTSASRSDEADEARA